MNLHPQGGGEGKVELRYATLPWRVKLLLLQSEFFALVRDFSCSGKPGGLASLKHFYSLSYNVNSLTLICL